ncbi:hypothetical protein E2C01_033032 [Portunus trituberculatus]|uniref:Uncharacterized protein n=1 Tax=Portunus trituberculatus TaxID=210409 RepID=A0A5B7F1C3_PORTR|nr:hypothetical protein [Portunus trituberculatus]
MSVPEANCEEAAVEHVQLMEGRYLSHTKLVGRSAGIHPRPEGWVKEGLRRERWLPNPCNSLGQREGVIDAQGFLQVTAGRSLPDYQEWWQTLTRIDP